MKRLLISIFLLFPLIVVADEYREDFSFTEPVFFMEDNDVLLDKDMGERVLEFCSGKYEIVQTKSIYYKNRKDFSAYLTFRCINCRTTVDKPNFDGMCSSEFCYESYSEAING